MPRWTKCFAKIGHHEEITNWLGFKTGNKNCGMVSSATEDGWKYPTPTEEVIAKAKQSIERQSKSNMVAFGYCPGWGVQFYDSNCFNGPPGEASLDTNEDWQTYIFDRSCPDEDIPEELGSDLDRIAAATQDEGPEWTEHDNEGEPYWVNSKTRESTLANPFWNELAGPDGYPCWRHTETGETTRASPFWVEKEQDGAKFWANTKTMETQVGDPFWVQMDQDGTVFWVNMKTEESVLISPYWIEQEHEGRPFYVNTETQETTWVSPFWLKQDHEGTPFWVNTKTQESSWTDPNAPAGPPQGKGGYGGKGGYYGQGGYAPMDGGGYA